MLRRQQSSIEKRVKHELRDVTDELVHDTEERDVAHLPGHAIGARPYEDRVNVLRLLARDDLSQHLVKCQGARGDRFIPGSTFAGQFLDLNLGSRDSGILLDCKVGFGYGRPLEQNPPCYYLPRTEPTAQRPRVAIPGSGFTDFCLRTDMQTHVIGQGPT